MNGSASLPLGPTLPFAGGVDAMKMFLDMSDVEMLGSVSLIEWIESTGARELYSYQMFSKRTNGSEGRRNVLLFKLVKW